MQRLPTVQTVSEMARNSIPVGSNESIGTSCLQSMVNTGEKRNRHRVFLSKRTRVRFITSPRYGLNAMHKVMTRQTISTLPTE